jgi:hypothetical protein
MVPLAEVTGAVTRGDDGANPISDTPTIVARP